MTRRGAGLLTCVVLLATACGGNDAEPAPNEPPPAAAPSPTATQPAEGDGDGPAAVSDPAATWLAGAQAALAVPDPSYLQQTVHSWLASTFRSCPNSWLGQAGVDWTVPAVLEADPEEARDQEWTGTSGPLTGQTFPDARVLPVQVTVEGADPVTVEVPYVVIGDRLAWLADCPGQPSPAPATASPSPSPTETTDVDDPTDPGEPTASPEPSPSPAPQPSPSPQPPPPPPSPSPSPSPAPQPIQASGSLQAAASFGGDRYDDAWRNCDGKGAERYVVRALSSSGSTLATASISGGTYRRDEFSWGAHVTCDFTYTVTVPPADSYVFTLTTRSDGVERDRASRSRQQLQSDGAPRLYHHERFGL